MNLLMNILSGQEIKETLNTTGFYLSDAKMAFDPFNPSEPSASASKEEKVGIIQVHHPIFKYDQMCGPKGTQTIMSILEGWRNDESVIGVVMDFNEGGDEVFKDAVRVVVQARKASTTLLQNKLRIGYPKASRIMSEMEEQGIIGPADGSKPREVMISSLDELDSLAD